MDNNFNPVPPATAPTPLNHQAHRPARRSSGVFGAKVWLRVLKAVVVVAIIVGVALLIWWHFYPTNSDRSEAQAVNTSEYQAVFLTNGQVYFGKLTVVNPIYLKLTDIYYLQVQQSVQPSTTNPSSSSTSGSNNNVQLVKLGNELHGPEDMMAINREQVLFWENLKPSGKVTQAIDQYQSK